MDSRNHGDRRPWALALEFVDRRLDPLGFDPLAGPARAVWNELATLLDKCDALDDEATLVTPLTETEFRQPFDDALNDSL